MKKLLAAVLFSALLLSLLSAAAGEDAMHEIPVTEVGPLFIGQTENAPGDARRAGCARRRPGQP